SYFHARAWVVCATLILIGVPWILRYDHTTAFATTISSIAALCATYTLLLGPQIARQDIRRDLTNIDILKTYPLAGW
ncbi:MAG: hypothetical protein WCQ44_09750, partial [Opitutaceae bacterium]